MPPVGFEPTISAGERPYTHALDRAATGTGDCLQVALKNKKGRDLCLALVRTVNTVQARMHGDSLYPL